MEEQILRRHHMVRGTFSFSLKTRNMSVSKQKCELSKGHQEVILRFSDGQPVLLGPDGRGACWTEKSEAFSPHSISRAPFLLHLFVGK